MASKRSPDNTHVEFIARGLLSQGSWLLLCRNSARGHYYLPGGHVEFGEASADACAREFAEETGLRVVARDCVFAAEVRFKQGGRSRHEVNLVFHVEPDPRIDLLEPGAHAAPRRATSDHSPTPSPIASLEPGIQFEWVDFARIIELDVRPRVIQAWIASGGRVESPQPNWLSVEE